MALILFFVFAIAAVLSGICVAFSPFGNNPVYSAIALIMTLFFLACEFVLLHATFIAVLQILVYAGAIMVLFTFVIMLLNLSKEEIGEERLTLTKVVGLVVVLIGLTYQIGRVIWAHKVAPVTLHLTDGGPSNPAFGTIQDVGVKLFQDFLVPFEVTSILLLVAIVGAVVLAKRKI
ncbi:MAG: NADH-quinone oxidoreductase subunit J [Myxococcales bacterium]|nr:NADH-quinone oxidoreductase subunit J [Myxococcales bacterium]